MPAVYKVPGSNSPNQDLCGGRGCPAGFGGAAPQRTAQPTETAAMHTHCCPGHVPEGPLSGADTAHRALCLRT